ncbi:MAG: sigma-E factor regulatory protein RseB domain-containing protein [Armatimonadota bacterium]|jgi:outer membrane lipoprotein-sorting protein
MKGIARLQVISVALLLCGIAMAFASHPDADRLVRMSYKAQETASYSCRINTIMQDRGKRLISEADIYKDGRATRINYLSGPAAGTSVIDNGRTIMRFVPVERLVYVIAPERENLSLMLSNYSPEPAGRGMVAKRSCFIIRLAPIHKGNPWKKLWIDRDSYLTLRTDSYNSDGRLISSTELHSVNCRPQSPKLFAVPKGWKTRQISYGAISLDLLPVSSKAGVKPVRPGYIPKGYKFAGYGLTKPSPPIECVTLRYTNGLNSITLMETKGKCTGRKPCCKTDCMFSKRRHARMVQRHFKGLNIVLISDIAKGELIKMAESLK